MPERRKYWQMDPESPLRGDCKGPLPRKADDYPVTPWSLPVNGPLFSLALEAARRPFPMINHLMTDFKPFGDFDEDL